MNFGLTVLTSSFVSSAIFYWLTSRKERSQFRRGKLEELFMAYQAYWGKPAFQNGLLTITRN